MATLAYRSATLTVLLTFGALLAFACDSGQTEPSSTVSPAECRSDSDCAKDERCDLALEARRNLAVVAPVTCPDPCSTDADCGTGNLCKPIGELPVLPDLVSQCQDLTAVCIYPCSADSCPNGQICRDDSCVAGTCEDPEAPACPEMWECDPGSVRVQSPSSADEGVSDSVQSTEAARFISLGCVRKVCDAPDGFTCGSGWTCDPSDPASRGAGCVPTPCQELGRCSSGSYVCEPANDNPRPEGVDAHGCVRANCLEVETICSAVYEGGIAAEYCDPTSERADDRGCANRLCDELLEVEGLDACSSNTDRYVCAPSAANANTRGCVDALCQNTADYQCSSGGICDPLNDLAGTAGCVTPSSTGQGGAGHTGPVASAGSPSGGSSSVAGGSTSGSGGSSSLPGSGGSGVVTPSPAGAGGSGSGVKPSTIPVGAAGAGLGDGQGGSTTPGGSEPGTGKGDAGAMGSGKEDPSSGQASESGGMGRCVGR